MLTSIPQARIVSKAGQQFAPPPAPPSSEASALREQLRTAVAVALGMWPLTCIVLLMLGLLVMAGNAGSP